MTQKEAIKAWDKWMENGYSHSVMPNSMALVMAYNALRGPTREQVEKLRGEVNKVDKFLYTCSRCGSFIDRGDDFCCRCGVPLTDGAVDILMKRLEALKDGTTD